MRPLLGIAVLTLLLSCLLMMRKTRPPASDRGALDLIVFSKGAFVTAGSHPLIQRYGANDGVIANDRVLNWPNEELGMRAAAFGQDFSLDHWQNYPVSSSAAAVESLNQFCRSRPVDTILVLQHFGSLSLDAEAASSAALQETIREIGAKTEPWQFGSWCLIAVRRPHGWAVLAESFAASRAAALAFSVSPDLSIYDWYSGDRIVDHSFSEASIKLIDQLSHAEWGLRQWRQPIAYAQINHSAIATNLSPAPPEKISESTIVWPKVRLGATPVFQCAIAMQPPPPGTIGRVTFSLTINNEPLETKSLSSDEAGRWFDWRIDLSAYSERSVALELGLESAQGGLIVYWGDPVISWRGSP